LSGDQAARILDIAGIVVNRNTIPGDRSAFDPSGIRMGTPWLTQRGFKEAETIKLADIISDLLKATTPVAIPGRRRPLRRARVDFTALEDARLRTRDLALSAGMDFEPTKHGYPHFYYIDDQPTGDEVVLELSGERVRAYLNFVVSSDTELLEPGQTQATRIHAPREVVDGALTCLEPHRYRLTIPSKQAAVVTAWLRDLSDGFICVDEDLLRKIPGPVIVENVDAEPTSIPEENPVADCKPYSVFGPQRDGDLLPEFAWEDQEGESRRTPLFDLHKELGAKIIPFAGWEMPVWYTSVLEEHLAVRQAAGVFDVAHMGVYQVEGPDAVIFLDSVVGNDIGSLRVGDSCYTHFLDQNAEVIDDLLVYRRQAEKYLVVVNASNDDKDWAWLQAVRNGEVKVDNQRPCTRAFGRKVILRNLRDPQEGDDMRVDIALQGPRSRDVLLALGTDDETQKRIMALKRTQLCEAVVGGFDLVVSRTGYTGERMAFELFVHPEKAKALFRDLLKVGETYGLKPIGLGARDSLRTEAGLPLYGHEMGAGSGQLGEPVLGVADAGFGSYVKTYKPWFIGRQAYMEKEKSRKGVVARFRFDHKGVRMAHNGDPVLDPRGRVVGWVTSCAVDADGYLTGQAYLTLKSAVPDTSILIYQGAPSKAGKTPADLGIGDRSSVPSPATVVRRFPK
jgi:glycine hydroxymethyltransferase